MTSKNTKRKLAAGSLAAAAAVIAAAVGAPYVGGCGDAGKALSGITKSVGPAVGGTVGGKTGSDIQRGLQAAEGAGELASGFNLSPERERALGEIVALQGVENYRIVNDDAL